MHAPRSSWTGMNTGRTMRPEIVQIDSAKQAVARAGQIGMQVFRRPTPQRLSEWSEDHFYLSAESSYAEGRWECLSFQRGPMDVISNDDVSEIWFSKSARVGYTKIILAASQYFAAHRRRNVAIWQPTDDDRDEFAKTEVDTAIRDNPAIREIFPAYDKRSKHNTMALKQFIGSSLHLRGGKAAKNYRRLSVDVAILDELDGFDGSIEREGAPYQLAQRRTQGSSFGKLICGSTPKLKHNTMIERGEEGCDARIRWHVCCPHCDHEQQIHLGGTGTEFGMHWQ